MASQSAAQSALYFRAPSPQRPHSEVSNHLAGGQAALLLIGRRSSKTCHSSAPSSTLLSRLRACHAYLGTPAAATAERSLSRLPGGSETATGRPRQATARLGQASGEAEALCQPRPSSRSRPAVLTETSETRLMPGRGPQCIDRCDVSTRGSCRIAAERQLEAR